MTSTKVGLVFEVKGRQGDTLHQLTENRLTNIRWPRDIEKIFSNIESEPLHVHCACDAAVNIWPQIALQTGHTILLDQQSQKMFCGAANRT